MNSSLGFEVLLIVALVLVNGVFAMSEIAVVSSRKSRLLQRAEAGDKGGRRALELAEHPTRFLSTVQIGITPVGVFAGAYGGASIAGQLDTYLSLRADRPLQRGDRARHRGGGHHLSLAGGRGAGAEADRAQPS